jgi:hypothetical protein
MEDTETNNAKERKMHENWILLLPKTNAKERMQMNVSNRINSTIPISMYNK